MDKAGVGAVLIEADPLVLEPNRRQIVELAATQRLPSMCPWSFYTESGGLMSYAASIPGFHQRSAMFVSKILKGEKPGEIPVEQPTTFELMINARTAKALGLVVPKSLMLRADQVIN